MREEVAANATAMEGGGAYNRNSGLQRANLGSALPLLGEAANIVPIDHGGPILIADYGCSEGRNSMKPMGLAIDTLRARAGPERPVSVIHADLPGNDFSTLLTMLDEAPESYLAGQPNVFPAIVGRSYFDPILPPESVDLGWSSNALHWLGRGGVEVPDHGWAVFSAVPAARAAAVRQLDEDWRRFLLARATELRPGGRIVCQFLGHGPETHGFEWMAGLFWQSIVDMAQEGLLTEAELRRMTCPSAGRTIAEIEAPFDNGPFAGLVLENLSLIEAPDPYWDAYRENGDAAQLGRSWAAMMRAANGPTFAAGLAPGSDRSAFLDGVEARLADHVARAPERSRSYITLLTIAKIA